MPIKMIVMVKRKPGLSPQAFRDGYENGHSRIAVRLFGHLWTAYRRNYLTTTGRYFGMTETGPKGPDDIGYDAISEFILPDAAAMAEMGRIAAENQAMIHEDEKRWFDRKQCWVVGCETIEEDLEKHKRQRAAAG